jgi:hypothetical protein
MRETIIQQCLNMLKRNDVKKEIKSLIDPIIYIFFEYITPYIYVIICLIFLIFIMILAILLLLIYSVYFHNKQ